MAPLFRCIAFHPQFFAAVVAFTVAASRFALRPACVVSDATDGAAVEVLDTVLRIDGVRVDAALPLEDDSGL